MHVRCGMVRAYLFVLAFALAIEGHDLTLDPLLLPGTSPPPDPRPPVERLPTSSIRGRRGSLFGYSLAFHKEASQSGTSKW